MQAYGGIYIALLSYTQTLIGGEWSESRLGRLIPGKETNL